MNGRTKRAMVTIAVELLPTLVPVLLIALLLVIGASTGQATVNLQ